MKQTILGLLLLFTAGLHTYAQDVQIDFSSTKKLKVNKDGEVTEFIGATKKLVFSYNQSISGGSSKKYDKLIAYDKKTLKEVNRLPVYGYGTERFKKLKNAAIIGKLFTDKEIMLVYKIRGNKKEDYEIYGEVWDENFKNKISLKKITSVADFLKGNSSRELIDIRIVQSENKKEFAAIMEFSNGQDKSLTMSIIKFDMKLSKFPSSTADLPISQIEKKAPSRMTGTYYYPGDGYVYTKHIVLEDNDRTKKKWKKGKRKLVIHRFDSESENIDEFEIKDEEYSLSDITIISNGKTTKIVGFYQNPESTDKENLVHGVFVVGFNSRNKELEEITFEEFDREDFEMMFHSRKLTQLEQKRADKKAKKNKSAAAEKDPTYSMGDLIIDDIKMDENGNITIFSSFMENYTIQRCRTSNGVTTCYDEPYCRRTDVNVMHLNNKNELEFALHTDRTATYSGWYVYDLKTSRTGDMYYIYYGDFSDYLGSQNRKEARRKRKEDGVIDFKYAVLDLKNREIIKKTKAIEQISTKKKEIRMINAQGIDVIDGEVYSFNIISRMGYKAIPVYLLIFPQYFAMSNPQMVYNYYGTISKITPL